MKRRGIALFAPLLACGCRQETTTLFVDCAEANGGRGSERRPYDTIGAALDDARERYERMTISVAAGTCEAESYPLVLDLEVALVGARQPDFDADGWPTGDAEPDSDTVLTFPEGGEWPAKFVEITAPDVTISNLSVDGRYALGPDEHDLLPGPSGVEVVDAPAFDLHDLRLANLFFAVYGSGSSGRVADNYLGPVNVGCGLHGATWVVEVVVEDNRLDYRVNGIVISAGERLDVDVPAITARIDHNDVTTRFQDTGPSNPAGLRIAPALDGATHGEVVSSYTGNRVGGPVKYPILVFAFAGRDGVSQSGSLDLTFTETVLDEAAGDPMITFSHAQVPAYPCSLDPAADAQTCAYPGPWDYLEGATFTFHDDGALAAARVDHPANDPIDGRVLANTLVINDVTIANETFVVVP